MGVPVYASEGFNAIAQNYITRTIASQPYAKSALLYLLAGLGGASTDEPLNIGRPGESVVLSGLPVTKAKKMSLSGINQYRPRIQAFKTNNTVMMGARPTMPTVNSPTTLSNSQAGQATAEFHWAKMTTPILVWQEDLDRALDDNSGKGREGQGIAAGQVIEEATRVAMEEHLDQLASRLLYGYPANEADDPWLDFSGIIPALNSVTTAYGRITRSNLTAPHPWLPNVDTTATNPTDIDWIINDANITKKCNVVGHGINAILCGAAHYITFKNQVLSRGGVIVQNTSGYGLPSMAKYGVEREVLRKDNVYIMHEPFLDTCYGQDSTGTALYTAQTGYVIALNLAPWTFITHPRYNVKASKFTYIKEYSEGAKDAHQGFIETKGMCVCERPNVQALYTAIP